MRLIDANALKKEIRENDPFGGMNYEWYIDHAPTIDTASPWHRVEEELPKVGTNCLVGWKHDDGFYYEDSVYGYGADGFGFWCRKAEHDKMVEPDYWMPIEPPKEDA